MCFLESETPFIRFHVIASIPKKRMHAYDGSVIKYCVAFALVMRELGGNGMNSAQHEVSCLHPPASCGSRFEDRVKKLKRD